MDVQQSKKELASIFLSPHDGGGTNRSIERLHVSVIMDLDDLSQMTDLSFQKLRALF